MAAILSFFIPGLGHLILGRPFTGLFLLVLCVVGYFLVVPGLIVHVFAIWHAHQLSRKQHIADMAAAMKQGNQ